MYNERTHDEFDDGIVERVVLKIPRVFNKVKEEVEERIVEYAYNPASAANHISHMRLHSRRSDIVNFCTLHTSYRSRTESVRNLASMGTVPAALDQVGPGADVLPIYVSSTSGSISTRT